MRPSPDRLCTSCGTAPATVVVAASRAPGTPEVLAVCAGCWTAARIALTRAAEPTDVIASGWSATTVTAG